MFYSTIFGSGVAELTDAFENALPNPENINRIFGKQKRVTSSNHGTGSF